MLQNTQFHEGRLTVSEVMSDKPTVFPLGTSLVRVAEVLSQSRFRHGLVSNAEGRVMGVVSSSDLLRHMAGWNANDSSNWESKTVESVMTTKFIAAAPSADASDVAPLVTSSSIQCVPVIEEGKLVGVLTPDDLLLSWNRLDPVLREAATDSVTELSNRATFNRRLWEEWDRCSRQNTPIGLIIIDVDYFKSINDSCGHLSGDAVLHLIGASLRRHLRSYDVVARYGGDEFAAICCGCSQEDIDVPINRLQTAVRKLTIPTDADRRSITLSIGAAVIQRGYENCKPEDLIAKADECLYHAKRNGRDMAYRVEFSPSDGVQYEPVLVGGESTPENFGVSEAVAAITAGV